MRPVPAALLAGLAALAALPAPLRAEAPLPIEIEVRFDLVDQTGARVTEADFAGRPMAVFFGYTACESICDVALPSMAEALRLMGPDADRLTAVMITVDPETDTPERLAAALPEWHEDMVGLTGSEAALAAVRERFQVEVTKVAEDPTGAPIYAHGSFVYVIGADGGLRSLLPPILSPERMAELMRKAL